MNRLGKKYNILSVETGEDAVAEVQNQHIDLAVIGGCIEGKMSSPETIGRILEYNKGTPIVIYSKYNKPVGDWASKWMAKAYVTIKEGVDVLAEKIDECLNPPKY